MNVNRRLLWGIALVLLLSLIPAQAEGPLIGLIYTLEDLEKEALDSTAPRRQYRDAIGENGGRIVVLGQGWPASEIKAILETLDGVLLPGGIDVDPKFYGEAPSPKLEKTDAALDALEFQVLEYAKEHRLPVLGICRGHQVLNVFYGGSLIQDIPTEHESETNVVHRGGTRKHTIAIEEGSLLHELLGATEFEVNTYHHQAVKRLAEGFKATAHTKDGIVEAIESQGDVFILGVQFHPERMRAATPAVDALFQRFLKEAEKFRQKRNASTAASP
jgi:putative glutamine amidotransferase